MTRHVWRIHRGLITRSALPLAIIFAFLLAVVLSVSSNSLAGGKKPPADPPNKGGGDGGPIEDPPEDFAVTQSSDVDGDGTYDTIVGEPAGQDLKNPDPGQVFISSSFMKKNKGGGGIAGGLAGDGFTIIGSEPDDYFGAAVAVVGSLNGDIYKDLIIGAPNHTSGEGRAFVFYGPFSNPSNPTLYASDANMVIFSPDAADYGFGTFVGAVNDINCDGVPDLRIGGFFTSGSTQRKHSYYVSGADGEPLYMAVELTPFNSWSEQPGDAEGDGDVDSADVTLVQHNLGYTGGHLTPRDGDFNNDHVVNNTDLAIAQNNVGANKFTSLLCFPICPQQTPAGKHCVNRCPGVGGTVLLPSNVWVECDPMVCQAWCGFQICGPNPGTQPVLDTSEPIELTLCQGLLGNCNWEVLQGDNRIQILYPPGDQNTGVFRFLAIAPGPVTVKAVNTMCDVYVCEDQVQFTIGYGVDDLDGDGLTDSCEMAIGSDPLDPDDPPVDGDADSDGLSDLTECNLGSNPGLADSDGDGLNDGEEVQNGWNPLSEDTDRDGVSDGQEVNQGTDPADASDEGEPDPDNVIYIHVAVGDTSNLHNNGGIPNRHWGIHIGSLFLAASESDYPEGNNKTFPFGNESECPYMGIWNTIDPIALKRGSTCKVTVELLDSCSPYNGYDWSAHIWPTTTGACISDPDGLLGDHGECECWDYECPPCGLVNTASGKVAWIHVPTVDEEHPIDLQIDSNNDGSITVADDQAEMNEPGKYIPFNNDDDNNNGMPDWADADPTQGEDDLVPVQLSSDVPVGEWILHYFSTAIQVWQHPDRSGLISNGGIYDTPLPSTLYVEGFALSGTSTIMLTVHPSNWEKQSYPLCSATWNDQVDATVGPYSIDLDIDSDNDNGFDPPDRSQAEEDQEDVEGDSAKPGKVVLVNSLDFDGDGLTDYADGFNHLGVSIEDDDLSSESLFTPVILEVHGLSESVSTLLTISYSASDPAALSASADEPFVLPSGSLRLWTKPGSAARDPSPISQGGDYVSPGVYAPDILGLSSSSTEMTLYVESVRPSVTVADLAISVTANFDRSTHVMSDQVRITAPRVELLGRGFADSDFSPVSGVVATALDDPEGVPTPEGLTPGAWQTYVLRVQDPRSSIRQVILDGQSLTLTDVGDYYESPEFVGLPSEIPTGATLPPYAGIVVAGSIVAGEYNPWWFLSSEPDLDIPKEREKYITNFIHESVVEMETEAWTPSNPADDGAFGKEVHTRVTAKLAANNDGRWMMNVYVARQHPTEPFRKILSIGQLPPGGVEGTVEIDVLRLKDGYSPQVGDILDPNQIDDLYEIKTSAGGKIKLSQRTKLIDVRGGDIQISMCKRKWTQSQGWHNDPRISKILKILGLIGIPLSAYAIINSSSNDDEADELIAKLDDAYDEADDSEKRIKLCLTLNDLRNYLNHYDPSDSVDLVTLGIMYHMLGNNW